MNKTIINYDTAKFDFRAWASLILQVECLEKIHEQVDVKAYPEVARRTTISRNLLIQSFDRFKPVYVYFIRSVIAPIYGGVNSYQAPPSFHFHLSKKGNRAFRLDRSYGRNDSDHLNVWIPFTRAWDTNSIWIESENGKGDFLPAELEYGQALIFDGIDLRHGFFRNDTHSSRVSMEFRFSPHRIILEKRRSCSAHLPTGR